MWVQIGRKTTAVTGAFSVSVGRAALAEMELGGSADISHCGDDLSRVAINLGPGLLQLTLSASL